MESIPGLVGEVPLVYVDRSPDGAVSSVLPDNLRAGYAATEHLLGLGHRRIGILSEPLDVPNGADRLEGYKKALRAKRVPLDRSLVRLGGCTEESGYWGAIELLKLPRRPTAIVVCNNLMTLGLLAALRDTGLSCPKDISIVGFDDFEWCPHLNPPLSMIRVPAAELGAAAAKALLQHIRGAHGDAPTEILLGTELIVRQSTAPPAAEG